MSTEFPPNVRLWIHANKDRLPERYSLVDVVGAINDDFNLRDDQKKALVKDLMPEYNRIMKRRKIIAITVAVLFIGMLFILSIVRAYGGF